MMQYDVARNDISSSRNRFIGFAGEIFGCSAATATVEVINGLNSRYIGMNRNSEVIIWEIAWKAKSR